MGRQYHLFDYVGAPDTDRVIAIMGSGADVAHETVDYLVARGEKVGLLKVHLYRPFSIEHFLGTLPKSVKVTRPWIAPKSRVVRASRSIKTV